jgi:hypothetical protein
VVELTNLECAVMAAKLNADAVKAQQAEIRRLKSALYNARAKLKQQSAKREKRV